jgi:UDP-GlcNAc:undecaprenyl-phosphate GlcNAc-1-phosphate transferase
MLDGLDGLAGGVTLAILVPVLGYCELRGLNQVMLPGLVLASSIAAFLVFNYRFPWRERALVFMGDAGSNFLGFALAWIILSLNQGQSSGLSPIAVLWVVGFPVADTLVTMWRRRRKGLSAFHPDHEHVHYVLQRAGFGVNATVLIVSGLSALCAVVGLVASLDSFPQPLLTLALLALLASHNLLLARAWQITRKFRHLLTVPQRPDD